MGHNFRLVLLLGVTTATIGKYIFVQEPKTWTNAQTYCHTVFTDLAPFSNMYDIKLLHSCGNASLSIWIGLFRDKVDRSKWFWSGGGEVFPLFWDVGEPQDTLLMDFVAIQNYTLHTESVYQVLPSFCYKVHVLREEKTWEEALQYCRKYHRDLASVASDTEMMLMQKELSKVDSTENVWIGLHFLDGDWMWVDRQPRGYEAWGQGGKPWCPAMNITCAALQVMGTNVAYGLTDLVTADYVNVWYARDCNEKLHFLCY